MDDLLAMERELRGKVDAAKRDVAARQAVLSQLRSEEHDVAQDTDALIGDVVTLVSEVQQEELRAKLGRAARVQTALLLSVAKSKEKARTVRLRRGVQARDDALAALALSGVVGIGP